MYDFNLVAFIGRAIQFDGDHWYWPRDERPAPDLLRYEDRLYNVPRLLYDLHYGSLLGLRLPGPSCGQAGCINPAHKLSADTLSRTTPFYLPQPYLVGKHIWQCEHISNALVYTITLDSSWICDCPYAMEGARVSNYCSHVDECRKLLKAGR